MVTYVSRRLINSNGQIIMHGDNREAGQYYSGGVALLAPFVGAVLWGMVALSRGLGCPVHIALWRALLGYP